MMRRIVLTVLLLGSALVFARAQHTIHGVVRDCHTGVPLAFVNLISPDGRIGTSTDIEGRFFLKDVRLPIQLSFSYVGYSRVDQVLTEVVKDFEVVMCPQTLNLSEVVIVPWDNPALVMMRKVVKNRKLHDPAELESYSCDAYGKMVFSADTLRTGSPDSNIPDSTLQKIRKLLNEQYLFIMETASERTYTRGRLKEKVTGSRISGLKDPLFVFLISQLQSFSFYDDIIRISDKSYLNPASPGGLRKYLFSLEDTLYQESDTVYVIRYAPLPGNTTDAMRGLLYINSGDWAMQNVTAEPADAGGGISISIRQRYTKIAGHWFPAELGTSLLLKNVMIGPFYALGDGNYYLRNIRINETVPRPLGVVTGLEISRGAHKRDSAFWAGYRVAELGVKEIRTYEMIDSIGEAERLDKISRRLDALMRARFPLGPLELDLKKFIRYSEYEGIYGGIGLATNQRAIPFLSLSGHIGYGYGDNELKYGGELRVPVYRPMDMEVSAAVSHDLREGGMVWDPRIPGGGMAPNFRRLLIGWMDPYTMMAAAIKFRPMRDILLKAEFLKEELHMTDVPGLDPQETGSPELADITVASVELRYAIGERMLMSPSQVVSLGTTKPVFWLRARRGLRLSQGFGDPLTSLEFKALYLHRMPGAGVLAANLLSGVHFNQQPASLLFNGRGSYRPITIFAPNAFATARMEEFLSDRFVYLFLTHDLRHHLTGNRKLPTLRLHFNAGWSRLEQRKFIPEGMTDMHKVYLEGGMDIPDLLKLGIINLGAGSFYRFGSYSLGSMKENLAWKIVLSVPF